MSLLWGPRLFSGGLSPESAEVNAVEILWDSHFHEKISRTWYKTKAYHLAPSSSLNLTIRCKVGGGGSHRPSSVLGCDRIDFFTNHPTHYLPFLSRAVCLAY